MKKIVLSVALLATFASATPKTIFDSVSGMGITLNQKIKKDATGLFFLKPIEKSLQSQTLFKNILSAYNIKTDNLSCIIDGDLICIAKNKKKVIDKMMVVKVYGGYLNPDKIENIFNDTINIVTNLQKKYKTSFSCSVLSKGEFQTKLMKRKTPTPIVVASCQSKSTKPKIQVYIDMDGAGGDIVSFYNIEN